MAKLNTLHGQKISGVDRSPAILAMTLNFNKSNIVFNHRTYLLSVEVLFNQGEQVKQITNKLPFCFFPNILQLKLF